MSERIFLLEEENARLRASTEEERHKREALERENADLKRRLRLSVDEVRVWREKCELLEVDLERHPASSPWQTNGGQQSSDQCVAVASFDGEAHALEEAIGRMQMYRVTECNDLELLKQRMIAALDVGTATSD